MKVKELIEKLSKPNQDAQIMILDGSNGGGVPRTINLGPNIATINKYVQLECYDCEDLKIGTEVYVIGYGCY